MVSDLPYNRKCIQAALDLYDRMCPEDFVPDSVLSIAVLTAARTLG